MTFDKAVPVEASSWWALAAFVGLNFAAASTGAAFKPGDWYAALQKPTWTPPNWAFPLVWMVLYCTIAAAGWLVWEEASTAALPALAFYVVSLGFNAAWSVLFFGMRRLDWAMLEVLAFWLSIMAVIVVFAPIRPVAAFLLIPYLAWVTVAALLNLRLLQLNGGRGPTLSRQSLKVEVG